MATGTKIYTFLNKLTLYKETNKTTITKRILSEKEKKVKKRQKISSTYNQTQDSYTLGHFVNTTSHINDIR